MAQPVPVQMDSYLPDLETMINTKLNRPNAYETIKVLLKETGSVLAGGSVLQTIAKYETEERLDMDFYCPTSSIPKFLKDYSVLNTNSSGDMRARLRTITASLYCSSFLRRNGIRKIYSLKQVSDSPEAAVLPKKARASKYAQMVDIMSVRNSRKVTDVVQNFDLTFCQVWWDGEHIWATHPEDILQKKGVLQEDYAKLFIRNNLFLKKRVRKYRTRGFDIKLPILEATVDEILDSKICVHPATVYPYMSDPVFKTRWATRIIMRWLLGVRTKTNASRQLESGIDLNNILFVPLNEDRFSNAKQQFLRDQRGNILDERVWPQIGEQIITEPDDGYDSEDYTDITNLKTLAKTKHINIKDTEPDRDVIYYRQTNKLLEMALYPYTSTEIRWFASLGKLLEMNNDKFEPYKNALLELCTRKGECFIMRTDDETVYDIHDHPLEGAISQDGLEGYLEGHIKDVDKTKVPCYYKPHPPTQDDPRPTGNCYKNITMSEVRYILNNEFWTRYSAPVPIKTGLGESINLWDTILTNVKTTDEHYGDIFTKTICPYCLQFQERDGGCAYLGHDNPTGRPSSEYPYCQKDFVVQDIVDKYRTAAETINEGVPPHLEWCVECGRPSTGHEHFTITEPLGIETPPTKPNPHNPAQRVRDYGKCSGGGRPELYARILAIRKVYRDMDLKDPKEERMVAALAADSAPNDPELMEQGRAIYEKELAERKWGNANIPQNKIYNDPAYQPAEGGKRKTRKFNKRNAKTKYRR